LDFKKIELLKDNYKTVDYPGIGLITYKRNLKARRLSISVKNSAMVKVTIPSTLSFRSAESFVLSKSKWIVEKVEYFNKAKVNFSEATTFKTREHTLNFVPTNNNKILVKLEQGFINVLYPLGIEVSSKPVQEAAKKGIEFAYRYEAKKYLPNRVEQLAKQFGFKYGKIGIKKASTRWGSCSPKNNINLSLFLMKLPDNLIDYIILHELCHTVHKNHGPKFWSELDRLTQGNAKQLSKEVKKFRASI